MNAKPVLSKPCSVLNPYLAGGLATRAHYRAFVIGILMTKVIISKGDKFGRWTMLERVVLNQRSHWFCKCECGAEKVVSQSNLKSGASRSCGCLKDEESSVRNRTHGQSKTREYRIWKGMIKRCENVNSSGYHKYGGRGIKVSPVWRSSFEAFIHYMGPCPDGFSIDRIDCNGNYEPGNCRWACNEVQVYNKRNTITFEGKTLREWEAITGVSYGTLKRRFLQHGTIRTSDPRAIENRRAAA